MVEVLERKGLCTKQDLYIIDEHSCVNPRARIPERVFPETYRHADDENKIIDDILESLNMNGKVQE